MLTGLNALRGIAPLILRVVIGVIFTVHGYGKLFSGMPHFQPYVVSLGFPSFMAWVAAGTEFFGGVALILGLLTRWAALGIACVMAVAIAKLHWAGGLTGTETVDGYEYPLSLLAVAVSLMLTGAGPLSFDRNLIEKDS